VKKLEATWLSLALPGTLQIQLGVVRFIIYVLNYLPAKIKAIYYRQAEFLHQLAAVYEITTGIEHWWIGLTDLGRSQLTKQICPNTIYKIKKVLL
jgi:hypothetical protein